MESFAITAVVFFDTPPVTVPPADSISFVAALRESVGSVRVSTKAILASGPSAAATRAR